LAAAGIFMFTGLDPRSSAINIIVPLSVMAFGMGFGMAQRTNLIATAVPENEIGSASSVLALVRNISGAFGIAVFGTILNNSITSKLMATAYNSAVNITNAQVYKEGVSLMILNSYMQSYKVVFIVAGVILCFGALTSLLINVPKEKMANQKEVFIES
jgi:hypothetical protein